MPRVPVSVNSPARSLLAARSSKSAPDAGPSNPAADHLLSCIAGFYGDERQAHRTAEQIRREHGLVLNQMLLLGPRDAPRKQFARLAALWSGHWPSASLSAGGGRVRMALLGGVALMLAAPAMLLWSDDPGLFRSALTLPGLGGPSGQGIELGLGLGLGLGLVVAWLVRRQFAQPHVRRFEKRVQQQLAQGRWALVVGKLPWAQQAGVLALLRTDSLHWCAVAERSAEL